MKWPLHLHADAGDEEFVSILLTKLKPDQVHETDQVTHFNNSILVMIIN